MGLEEIKKWKQSFCSFENEDYYQLVSNKLYNDEWLLSLEPKQFQFFLKSCRKALDSEKNPKIKNIDYKKIRNLFKERIAFYSLHLCDKLNFLMKNEIKKYEMLSQKTLLKINFKEDGNFSCERLSQNIIISQRVDEEECFESCRNSLGERSLKISKKSLKFFGTLDKWNGPFVLYQFKQLGRCLNIKLDKNVQKKIQNCNFTQQNQRRKKAIKSCIVIQH